MSLLIHYSSAYQQHFVETQFAVIMGSAPIKSEMEGCWKITSYIELWKERNVNHHYESTIEVLTILDLKFNVRSNVT